MMKLDFGDVLGRMWKIGWNHKVLWLWQMLPGLFSALLMPLIFLMNPDFAAFLPEPWNQYANETWLAVAYVSITFILMIPIMFVGVIAQLATTYGALKAERGAEKLAFRELFSESLPYFWRVLGLYAIFGGVWMLIYFAIMAVIMLTSIVTFGLSMICMMPLFLLCIPIMIVGYSVFELAQAAIIADDMKTLEAISHGWKLFRANTLSVILLMVILYFALTTLSSLFIFPMMFPMMLFPLGIDSHGDINNMFLIFFVVLFPLMFIVMFAVQGILMAFFQSAWAVAYLRLAGQKEETPVIIEANA
ncbi:MAG: hypothetical protein HZB50_01010 [Chloroflexi bacterium]|nr:hypothetical protein [Chloroflexota bacterium]